MDCDFLRRNQRSKRACMKQILQIMLLIVCLWLLYQIQTERFGGKITISEEYKIVLLGRKVIPSSSSWLSQIPHFVAESENGTDEEKSIRSELDSDQKVQEINDHDSESDSDQKVQEINDYDSKYSKNINVQINEDDEMEDETDKFYRFHDENGVPPEEGNETEPLLC